jgi:hypothetical protein
MYTGDKMPLPFERRHISISIARSPQEVYDFVADPKNLPQWASGLGTSIAKVNGQWVAQTPQGPVKVRFAPSNGLGVLDHYVTLPTGAEIYVLCASFRTTPAAN